MFGPRWRHGRGEPLAEHGQGCLCWPTEAANRGEQQGGRQVLPKYARLDAILGELSEQGEVSALEPLDQAARGGPARRAPRE